MRTLKQLDSDKKSLLREMDRVRREIDDLEEYEGDLDRDMEQIEKEVKMHHMIPDESLPLLKKLITYVRKFGTGHEQRIVEEAANRELEDFEEIGRVKHLARQFLHITL